MEDEYPSIPSNYVSVVQLQERWLKEQQRKLREKEKQEKKLREEHQENKNGKRRLANCVSITRRNQWARVRLNVEVIKPNSEGSQIEAMVTRRNQWARDRRNVEVIKPNSEESQIEAIVTRRNQSARDHRDIEVIKPNSDESQIEAIVVQNKQKNDELKKLRKKKWKRNRKPRSEENLDEGTSDEPEEKVPAIVTERNSEKEGIRSEFRRNGGDHRVNRKVWEEKVHVDQTVPLERNFQNLSLNGGEEGKMKSTAEMNGGRWKHNGRSGRFDRRKLWNQRDCNLVWVKKGEGTETDIAGSRNRGTLSKPVADKKNPGQFNQT